MKRIMQTQGRKRLLVLAMCAVLLAGVLTGCIAQPEAQAGAEAVAEGNPSAETMATLETDGDGALSLEQIRALVSDSENTTQATAVAAGESAALESYLPIADANVLIRARVISYLSPEDFSQVMQKNLRYNQISEAPSAAVQLELEVYDYPNPQLPYLEDMMDIELLSAGGQVLGAMSSGSYTCDGFEPLTAVQDMAVVPGWMIVEVGVDEPACLRLITKDTSGQAHTAYLSLPQSDATTAPAFDLSPEQVAVGDTLTHDGATTRILGVEQTKYVFTSAVGNEYYSSNEGTQYIDVSLEYEGPQINAVLDILAAVLEDEQASPCEAVLLELPDHQNFSRSFETTDGANRMHLVLPAPETEAPVQILFSVNGAPYVLDYTPGDRLPAARAIEKGGSDTVEGRYTVKIDKVAYGKEVRSSVSNNKYRFHEAGDGNTLLIVTYQLTNLSPSDMILNRDCGVYVTFDADEKKGLDAVFYTGQVTRRASAGDLEPAMPIAPGEQSKVNYAFLDIPKDMKTRAGTIWLSVCDELYGIPVPAK